MSIRDIAEDDKGGLWLATIEGGPNFFDPAAGVYARRWGRPVSGHETRETSTVMVAPDGVIWLGTDHGVELFDPATGKVALLRNSAADPHALSANEVHVVTMDRDGTVWVGTKPGGVNRFSARTMRFGPWRRNPDDPRGLSDNNVRSIFQDTTRAIWIGTFDGGINRFDPVSGTFTQFRHDPRSPSSLDDNRVYAIYEDKSGELWFGTAHGLNRFNRETNSFRHYNRGPLDVGGLAIPTYSFLEDRSGRFWFGAGEARAVLDRSTGAITSVSKTGGLSMHEDRRGNLWFASNVGGLTKIDNSGNVRRIVPFRPGAAVGAWYSPDQLYI